MIAIFLVNINIVVDTQYIFVDKYPSGEMKKEDFVSYILEKDDMAEEDTAESLFGIFDKDQSGTMDFSEFAMASRATKVLITSINRFWSIHKHKQHWLNQELIICY